MRWVGKGFSGVDTPLFEGMLAAKEITKEGIAEEQVQADDAIVAAVQETVAEDVANEAIPSTPTPLILPSPPSHDIPSTSQVQSSPPQQPQISAASATISAAKSSIPVAAPTAVAAYTRRRKGVIIRDPEEELSSKTLAETPKLKDKGKGILIKTPKSMKKKDQIEMDAEYARKLHEEINKDNDWDAIINHVKQKSKENPQYIKRYQVMKKRPQTETQKAAKRRKLNEEAQEVEDLKKHLEVVDDEDDDVFTKATPLARKLILLVERRYLLSKFTLEQLVNVIRLQVEEESKMSLELLRFTR
nr:hypothetical protein [Tanacetum cinerariifolium]